MKCLSSVVIDYQLQPEDCSLQLSTQELGWKQHHHTNGALSLSKLKSTFCLIQMWGWKWHHHTNGALSLSNLTSNCFHSFCLIHNSWVVSRQANTEAPFQHNICGSISCKQIIVYRVKKEPLHVNLMLVFSGQELKFAICLVSLDTDMYSNLEGVKLCESYMEMPSFSFNSARIINQNAQIFFLTLSLKCYDNHFKCKHLWR